MVYMAQHHANLHHAWSTFVNGMAYRLITTPLVKKAADMREKYLRVKLRALFELLTSMFLKESDLREEKNQAQWNPTFSSSVHQANEADFNKDILKDTSREELQDGQREEKEKINFSNASSEVGI